MQWPFQGLEGCDPCRSVCRSCTASPRHNASATCACPTNTESTSQQAPLVAAATRSDICGRQIPRKYAPQHLVTTPARRGALRVVRGCSGGAGRVIASGKGYPSSTMPSLVSAATCPNRRRAGLTPAEPTITAWTRSTRPAATRGDHPAATATRPGRRPWRPSSRCRSRRTGDELTPPSSPPPTTVIIRCPLRGGLGERKSDARAQGNNPRFPWEPSTAILTYRLKGTTEAPASARRGPLEYRRAAPARQIFPTPQGAFPRKTPIADLHFHQ
jgi:hypothetical protein